MSKVSLSFFNGKSVHYTLENRIPFLLATDLFSSIGAEVPHKQLKELDPASRKVLFESDLTGDNSSACHLKDEPKVLFASVYALMPLIASFGTNMAAKLNVWLQTEFLIHALSSVMPETISFADMVAMVQTKAAAMEHENAQLKAEKEEAEPESHNPTIGLDEMLEKLSKMGSPVGRNKFLGRLRDEGFLTKDCYGRNVLTDSEARNDRFESNVENGYPHLMFTAKGQQVVINLFC